VTTLGLLIFLLDAAVWYLLGPLPGFITACVCWLAPTIWLRGRGDAGFGRGVMMVMTATTVIVVVAARISPSQKIFPTEPPRRAGARLLRIECPRPRARQLSRNTRERLS
jgi:hypothetical protein